VCYEQELLDANGMPLMRVSVWVQNGKGATYTLSGELVDDQYMQNTQSLKLPVSFAGMKFRMHDCGLLIKDDRQLNIADRGFDITTFASFNLYGPHLRPEHRLFLVSFDKQ
jgi:hypothetical protein